MITFGHNENVARRIGGVPAEDDELVGKTGANCTDESCVQRFQRILLYRVR